ncbi:MAG: hypothetical protein H6R21_264 [Proteobacteria bacterium]|nr:hypothetical protein [Pseudomonadota bacterium]
MIKPLQGARYGACLPAAAVALPAVADAGRPIRMVVIAAPAGAPDRMSRRLAPSISKYRGRQAVDDRLAAR